MTSNPENKISNSFLNEIYRYMYRQLKIKKTS